MWTPTKPPRRRQHMASLVLVNLLWSPALAGATQEQTEADRLNRALFDADSDVREEAVRALTEASASLALPALQQALSDSDARVRSAAIDALGDIGGDIVIGLLAIALVDPVPEVRERMPSTHSVAWASPSPNRPSRWRSPILRHRSATPPDRSLES